MPRSLSSINREPAALDPNAVYLLRVVLIEEGARRMSLFVITPTKLPFSTTLSASTFCSKRIRAGIVHPRRNQGRGFGRCRAGPSSAENDHANISLDEVLKIFCQTCHKRSCSAAQ